MQHLLSKKDKSSYQLFMLQNIALKFYCSLIGFEVHFIERNPLLTLWNFSKVSDRGITDPTRELNSVVQLLLNWERSPHPLASVPAPRPESCICLNSKSHHAMSGEGVRTIPTGYLSEIPEEKYVVYFPSLGGSIRGLLDPPWGHPRVQESH